MERVVFQEVANAGLAHRVKGTIMKGVILGDSLNYVYPTTADISNEMILAVLNSSPVNYYFKFFNQTNHVPIGEFRKIPFPNGIEAEREFLEAKVKVILETKAADPDADTSALETEIDEKICDLYELTPEEREIVRGGSGK